MYAEIINIFHKAIESGNIWFGLFIFSLLGFLYGLHILRALPIWHRVKIDKEKSINVRILGESKFGVILPNVDKKIHIGIGLIIGLFFFFSGLASTLYTGSLFISEKWPTKIVVYTGLAEDEFRTFEEVKSVFENKKRIKIQLKNRDWQETLIALQNKKKIDLITFDINGNLHQLISDDLIQDLKLEERNLIPTTTNANLMKYMKIFDDPWGRGKRGLYFVPFRPNVRMIYTKSKGQSAFRKFIRDKKHTSWEDLLELKNSFNRKDIIVLSASEKTAPLLLLDILRSNNHNGSLSFDPQKVKNAIRLLDSLWNEINCEASCNTDYRTASGILLSYDEVWIRNWAFTISHILKYQYKDDESRQCISEIDSFGIDAGPSFGAQGPQAALLGGEVIALPSSSKGRRRNAAISFIKYLVSDTVQTKFSEKLYWPAMRMDIYGKISSEQRQYQEQINSALNKARPVPEGWDALIYTRCDGRRDTVHTGMHDEFVKAFEMIADTSTLHETEIESLAAALILNIREIVAKHQHHKARWYFLSSLREIGCNVNYNKCYIEIDNVSAVINRLRQWRDKDKDQEITVDDLSNKYGKYNEYDSSLSLFQREQFRNSCAYYYSNLMQELVLEDNKKSISVVISLDRIFENPVDRISRSIKEIYWNSLTRTIDKQGLNAI